MSDINRLLSLQKKKQITQLKNVVQYEQIRKSAIIIDLISSFNSKNLSIMHLFVLMNV
jgi:hypothetical protein